MYALVDRERGFKGIDSKNKNKIKELTQVIVEVQNPHGRVVDWRPREELVLQLGSEGSLLAEFPLLLESSVFFLLRPFHY